MSGHGGQDWSQGLDETLASEEGTGQEEVRCAEVPGERWAMTEGLACGGGKQD